MTWKAAAPATRGSSHQQHQDAPGGTAVLRVEGVTAGYGDLAAVRDVTLEIAAGEVVALFGPNGSGKTTTLLASVGVLPISKGEVHWKGRAAPRRLHLMARAGLAFVPEERSIVAGLSTHDNLRLGRGRLEDALASFPELEALLDKKAGLLSGGEQQMLTLARALASKPDALLVDELSLGLAPLVVDRLLGVIRQAADNDGLAVLLVEQQARRALACADRWYLLRNGSIESAGDSESGLEHLEAAYLANMKTTEPAVQIHP